ncbi:MAG: HAD-IIIA family hydrolase [Clostridia bacterium]|nr:HAD-IIIA family hydrolase [Clostridia bacterium]
MCNATPRYIYESVTCVSPAELSAMGAQAVGIDLDNTTVYDSTFTPRKGVKEWLKSVKAAGFPVIIVSNTNRPRAWVIAKMFRLPYFAMSKKPRTKNVVRAAEFLHVPIENFAMIGDQLFADVQAANDCGAISVWVRPFMKEKLFPRYFQKIRDREREYCNEHHIAYKEIK